MRARHLAFVLPGLIFALASTGAVRLLHVESASPAAKSPATSIVLVTIDGVRTQELFDGPDLTLIASDESTMGSAMPYLVDRLIPKGTFIGSPSVDRPMSVGTPVGISLPGYQTLVTGRFTFCFSNECSPPASETLLDRLARDYGFDRHELVVFSTRSGFCTGTAAARQAEAVCGEQEIRDRWTQTIGARDVATSDIATPSVATPSVATPSVATLTVDEAAIDLAVERLRRDPPAFLHLALDDTDGAAHQGDYAAYLAALRHADDGLRRLDAEIDRLLAQGRSITLIVTTDHGRGRGSHWTEHRWNIAGTDEIWLFARGAGVATRGAIASLRHYTLRDVRPTIEKLLGLEPVAGLWHGRVVEDLIPGSDAPSNPLVSLSTDAAY
jgi:hypothetical protein